MNIKNDLLNELISKQIKNVYYTKKLSYNDLSRMVKYLDTSIFGNECSLWKGYVSKTSPNGNNYYVNFFFKKKKVNLHRLLHINFIGPITSKEYILYKCVNNGKCCNINHFCKDMAANNISDDNNGDDNSDDNNDDNSDDDNDGNDGKEDNNNIDDFRVLF